MKPELSVIIVNYNGLNYLKECLESLTKMLSGIVFEIIVIDNDSKDESCKYIKQHFPEVKLIESKINHGFGKGNNQAAKQALGDYLLLINNDTIVLDNLKPVLDSLKFDKTIGVVGINMLDASKEYIPAAGNFPNFRNMFQFKKLLDLGIEFKRGNFSKEQYEVGWLAGSFLLMPADTYNKIKGFDEDYFMYVEDVDICKKLDNINKRCIFIPRMKYIHFVGFNKTREKFLIEGYRIYVEKHFSGFSKFVANTMLTINTLVKRLKN